MSVYKDGVTANTHFLNVLPDGLHDYDPAFDPVLKGNFEGNIEIGRGGNNTLIGTDGDGVNDADERNVKAGILVLEAIPDDRLRQDVKWR